MKEHGTSGPIFSFGPFEFSSVRGELKKSGTPLKLQPQPARLLFLLLSNPGDIVTREQIQQAVWGGDVTVDYDLGVNRCIRQIRSLLLDSSESPRYIKTLPRLGYSFIAPVQQVKTADVGEAPGPAIVEGVEQIPESLRRSFSYSRRYRIAIWAVASGLVLIAAAQYLSHSKPALRIKDYAQLTNDSYAKAIKTGDLPRPILTDGSRVYFSIFTGAATSEIAEVAETGGNTFTVPTALASPILLDFSAAHSELFLSSGSGIPDLALWRLPLPDGSPRRISDISAHGASCSPDGEEIVYAKENSLRLASATGTSIRVLGSFDSRKGQYAYWPRWSPDGQAVRYSLYDGARRSSSLWEVSAGGGAPHALFPAWASDRDACCGTWSRDGRFYTFVVAKNGAKDIWAVSGKTMPVQLTSGPLSYSAPVPDKTGNHIFVIGDSPRSELARYDAGSRELVPFAPGVSASQADVSRNGKRLAFVSFQDGSLWQSQWNGTGRSQLTFAPLRITAPRWSPNGTRIAGIGRLPGEEASIYVVDPGIAAVRRLLWAKGHNEMDPDWSPNGQQLVFSDTTAADGQSALRIANVSAGETDVRTGKTTVIPGSAGLRSPRWSPDGRYIAALTQDLSSLDAYQVATGTWTRVAEFRMGYPNWSHDSSSIYVVNLAGKAAICRIRLADHRVETIVDMTRHNQYWTDDAWLGLTSADAPLLSRDISIQQIFRLTLGY